MLLFKLARRRLLLLGIALSASSANGALYTDPAQLPTDTFDFIVVGGGSGGNVIASRLTENPAFSVLVIEAGISNNDAIATQIPFIAPSNLGSPVTWNYTTVPQTALNNRSVSYDRGKVLGGCSSINFLTYTRGSDDEFDRWAALTGDQSWAWKNLIPYYFKTSQLVAPIDNHNTLGEIDPTVHGFGPVQVSRQALVDMDSRIVATAKTSGDQFPLNLDVNSGNTVGIGLVQSVIGGGVRSSSATAYLEPALNRSNLHVLIKNQVTKLIQTGTDQGLPAFRKVEFAANASTPRTVVTATKEVILSAGTVNTPQILLLSGIGPAEDLKSVGITPIVDLPDVGQQMIDQPLISTYWRVNSNTSLDDVSRNKTLAAAALAEWKANKTGVYTNTLSEGIAFLRLPSDSPIFETTFDPSAGPGSGHFEMIVRNGFTNTETESLPETGNFMTMSLSVVSPSSRGSVRLNSSDPFTFPIINPNFLNTTFDQFAMLFAVKAARAFLATTPWQGFVGDRFGVVGNATTDDEIMAAVRNSVGTIWHPTSSARMSPKTASWGVLDPQLLVKGTSGLRVVDASAFPSIPAVHTTAPVYILAERAADLIKAAWP